MLTASQARTVAFSTGDGEMIHPHCLAARTNDVYRAAAEQGLRDETPIAAYTLGEYVAGRVEAEWEVIPYGNGFAIVRDGDSEPVATFDTESEADAELWGSADYESPVECDHCGEPIDHTADSSWV